MATMTSMAALLAAFVPSATALTLEVPQGCGGTSMDFPAFVEKYGRSYQVGSEEFTARRSIFEQRVQRIDSHNCDPVGPWTAEINHLSDWTQAELKSLLGHRSSRRGAQSGGLAGSSPFLLQKRGESSMKGKDFPRDFSWANLTTIRANSTDQGTCGSCWAHAARLTMQARAEIKGLTELDWSTHQLIACTPNPKHCGGEGGCDGATAELAYEYVLNTKLLQDSEFHATAKHWDDQKTKCPKVLEAKSEVATRGFIGVDGSDVHRVGKNKKGLHGLSIGLTGWVKLPENKEEPLLLELVNNGPVYVAVAAGNHWFDYQSGVMTEDGCDQDFLVNHAVVLFGFGVKEKTVRGPVKYWQIKNSWGPTWGEQGTARIIRSDHEEKVCGWDEDPQEGSGCDGGPERVWVCGTCGILYDGVAPHFH